MQTNKKAFTRFTLIRLAIYAILASLSIVLGKYLAINLGETIRISFENLPTLLAGIFFGPIAGFLVGTVADLVGCLLVGYAINPLITLGAAAVGFVSGVVVRLFQKNGLLSTIFSVFSAHLIGSILIKTLGLVLYYGAPFFATLGMRSLTYLITATAECVILYFLLRNRGFTAQIQKLLPKEKKTTDKTEKE